MYSTAAASEPNSGELATVSRVAMIAAYTALGAALAWSRLLGLDHSFWTDEILMLDRYVGEGPRFILTGPAINHELMALLSWVVASALGDSEVALRLLSVVPFVAGVVLVTAWLHRRAGALAGVVFLFLATVSPLLLDISRQARGYGLAFLTMCVVVVGALEALRTGRPWPVAIACVAGTLGAWTLPQVALAFLPTMAVLVTEKRSRIAAVLGIGLSAAAIGVFYAPHLGAVRGAASVPDGIRIGFPWVVTAPVDQIVLPALIWIDGTALEAGPIWLPAIAIVALVGAASPLLREWRSALVLCAGAVTTVCVLWLDGAYVIPRYLSFLLAPAFVVLATGAAAIMRRLGSRPPVVRTVACVVVVGVLAFRFAVVAPDVVSLPREAHRDAARVVDHAHTSAAVLAYMRNPGDLRFYLARPVQELQPGGVAARVCGESRGVYYVFQDFALEQEMVPCLDRPGVESHRFPQYARGTMYVWWVPPR